MERGRFMRYIIFSNNYWNIEKDIRERKVSQEMIDLMFRIERIKDKIVMGKRLNKKEDRILDIIEEYEFLMEEEND